MRDRLGNLASASAAGNRQRSWRSVFLAFACAATVVASAYFLVVPAMTMSGTAYCGSEAHEHDAGCFIEVLQCDFDAEVTGEVTRSESHQHDDDCYEIQKAPICGFEGLEASAGGEGFSEGEPHVHAESCYEQKSVLVCDLAAADAVENDGALAEAHVHTDACRAQILNCDIKEHKHVLACFSNPDADLETAADWESTLPGEGEFSGVWANDLILVAESQLGYAESDTNYVVTDDETKKGYTRYGAWYGNAYGDWCAMFVAFCLEYAGIPQDAVPRDANCQNWMDVFAGEEFMMYYPVGAYAGRAAAACAAGEVECEGVPAAALGYFDSNEPFEPMAGDIVFFNWDEDAESDHVGIVVELLEATETEPAKVKTIEGNADNEVKYSEYSLDDASIMGYASLPIKPVEEAADVPAEYAGENLGSSGSTIGSTEGVLDGVRLWELGDRRYQSSWHKLGSSGIVSFALVPEGSKGLSSWSAKPLPWTASAVDANFVAAYCGDHGTYSSSNGAYYEAYLVSDARYSETAQRRLSTIVANTYPFISEAEMKAALEKAYPGENWVTSCDASQMLVASQWAIWLTTNPNDDYGDSGYSGRPGNDDSLYPISSSSHQSSCGRGSCSCEDRIEKMKDYLLGLDLVDDLLTIEDWSKTVEPSDDGTSYDVSVAITLNRSVSDAEKNSVVTPSFGVEGEEGVNFQVEYSGDRVIVAANDLTLEQVDCAWVSVGINGSHIQAYWLEADGYQDLITGNAETYDHSKVMMLGDIRDETSTVSVTVSKYWEDFSAPADSVRVALLANGEQMETVLLESRGDWTYSWDGLSKFDDSGQLVTYTVEEATYVEGYLPSISSGGKKWRKVSDASGLVSGDQYLIVAQSGALSWTKNNANASVKDSALEWTRANRDVAMGVSAGAVWTISGSQNGGYSLVNKASGGKRLYFHGGNSKYFTLGSGSDTLKLNASNGLWTISSGNSYFKTLGTGKVGEVDGSNQAMQFELYRLVDVSATDESEQLFLISNMKGTSEVSVGLKKVDAGNISSVLGSAKFDLYRIDEYEGEVIPGLGISQKMVKCNSISIVSDGRTGKADLGDLRVGASYYLVETEAPYGYEPLNDPICFVVSRTDAGFELIVDNSSSEWAFVDSNDSSTLVVKNSGGYVLPETGGEGLAARGRRLLLCRVALSLALQRLCSSAPSPL